MRLWERAIQWTADRRTPLSILAGAITGAIGFYNIDHVFLHPSRPATDYVLNVFKLASPIAGFCLSNIAIGLAEYFVPGNKREAATLPNIIGGESQILDSNTSVDNHTLETRLTPLPKRTLRMDPALPSTLGIGLATYGLICVQFEDPIMSAFPAGTTAIAWYLLSGVLKGGTYRQSESARNFKRLFAHVEKSEIDEALLIATDLVERGKLDYHPFERPLMAINMAVERAGSTLRRTLNPTTPQNEILSGVIELADGQTSRAHAHFKRAITKAEIYNHPLTHECRLIYSIHTNDWADTIKHILEDDELPKIPLGTSDTTVTTVTGNLVLQNRFAIKQSKDVKSLKAEHRKTLELERLACEHDKWSVVTPLAFVGSLESAALVTSYEPSDTLRETADPDHYIEAIEYLGFIHKNLSSKREPRDYRTVLQERLQTGPLQAMSNRIYRLWDCLWSRVQGLRAFDKDPHGDNWLVTEDGKLIALDIADKGLTDQCIQLAKFTMHSNAYSPLIDSRVPDITTYATRAPSPSVKQLLEGTFAAAPIVAFNAAHYSLQGRAPHDMTHTYIANAQYALTHLSNEFGLDKRMKQELSNLLHHVAEIEYPLQNQSNRMSAEQ